MASNEHNSLPNDQLHNPKDFSTASNNTVLTKNGSGNISWQDDRLRTMQHIRVAGFLSGVTSTSEFAPVYAGGTTHQFTTVTTDPTADAQDAVAQAQLYCTRAGFVNAFNGVLAATSGKTINLKVYKGTPADASSAAINLTQLGSTATEVGGGNTNVDVFAAGSLGSSATFAAGDVIIVTISAGNTDSTTCRFNGTLEIVYTE